jgi:NAD(P)H-hydrate epimerase
MKKLNLSSIRKIYIPREKNAHKGNYGHALIAAGRKFHMGACVIAAKACYRSGAGMLTVDTAEDERAIIQISVPEAMTIKRGTAIKIHNLNAIGIGPAIGIDNKALKLLTTYLKLPIQNSVIDADALTLISQHPIVWNLVKQHAILTPHEAEFDRLFGIHATREERITTAIHQAKKRKLIIVLKGLNTVITNGYASFMNTTGNAGLAKAGSGDGLLGMITGLLAQGYSPLDATQLGVYIHGLAADLALSNQSVESMLISDVIDQLGKAYQKILN